MFHVMTTTTTSTKHRFIKNSDNNKVRSFKSHLHRRREEMDSNKPPNLNASRQHCLQIIANQIIIKSPSPTTQRKFFPEANVETTNQAETSVCPNCDSVISTNSHVKAADEAKTSDSYETVTIILGDNCDTGFGEQSSTDTDDSDATLTEFESFESMIPAHSYVSSTKDVPESRNANKNNRDLLNIDVNVTVSVNVKTGNQPALGDQVVPSESKDNESQKFNMSQLSRPSFSIASFRLTVKYHQ